MQRLIVTTIATQKVNEQWVVDIPDDVDWRADDFLVADAFFDRLNGEEDDPKYLVMISDEPKIIGAPDVSERTVVCLEEWT